MVHDSRTSWWSHKDIKRIHKTVAYQRIILVYIFAYLDVDVFIPDFTPDCAWMRGDTSEATFFKVEATIQRRTDAKWPRIRNWWRHVAPQSSVEIVWGISPVCKSVEFSDTVFLPFKSLQYDTRTWQFEKGTYLTTQWVSSWERSVIKQLVQEREKGMINKLKIRSRITFNTIS